jgi:hypothetical protein
MKYKELFVGVPEKDHEARDLLMAPYNEWLDEHETVGLEKDVKSVAVRVQQCKDQMASMVRNMVNLAYIQLFIFPSRLKVGQIWRILRL